MTSGHRKLQRPTNPTSEFDKSIFGNGNIPIITDLSIGIKNQDPNNLELLYATQNKFFDSQCTKLYRIHAKVYQFGIYL